MSWVTICVVSFLTGVFASMGLGGGMVLIMYLTIFAGMPQLQAQGINLVFFVPIAVLSLVLHSRNGLVEWKKAFSVILAGAFSVLVFSFAANKLDPSLLRKGFAVFLILAGAKEMFSKAALKQTKK